MILAAHVGIGISGLEGQQAARASDYSISQFSYLKRLLFVHGRECYRRNATLICYNFYKNVLLVMPLFFYGIFSVFSGQILYNQWSYQTYNVFYVALPIILYAVFDREIDYDRLESNPEYFKLGLDGKLLDSWEFWGWLLEAIIQAFIITFVSVYALASIPGQDGRVGDMWIVSSMIFGSVVILANLKVFLFSYSHYWFTVMILIVSVAVYYLVVYTLMDLFPILTVFDNYDSRGVFIHLFGNPNFYTGAIFIIFTCFFVQPVLRCLESLGGTAS